MKVVIPAEADKSEARVAATPESVKKLIGLGAEVVVEAGAGAGSDLTDEAYDAAGATLAADIAAALGGADVVLTVRRPDKAQLAAIGKDAVVIGQMDPFGDRAGLTALAKTGLTAFAMELMPRITRAQSMDVLSSQSNLAGYKAVIDAPRPIGRAFPMMMTAAGTVPPAKVFVMGAGVAGLQAIATARRLGAIVSATDVRPAAKEQVAVARRQVHRRRGRRVPTPPRPSGGYAKEMSAEYRAKQAALVADAHQEAGHRHHHGAHSGPSGAGAGDRGDGRDDEAGIGGRRSRRRARRQLPAVEGRQGRQAQGRHHHRPPQRRRGGSRPMPRSLYAETSSTSSISLVDKDRRR